jgi:hypothetical protein
MTEIKPIMYSDTAIHHNARVIDYCRSFFCALSGITCGILGLTSWQGFLFFILTSLLMSSLFKVIRISGPSALYFQNPTTDIWMNGLTSGLFAYVLFWTMVNGIIRIYN